MKYSLLNVNSPSERGLLVSQFKSKVIPAPTKQTVDQLEKTISGIFGERTLCNIILHKHAGVLQNERHVNVSQDGWFVTL